MTIPADTPSKWNNALIESTTVANQTCLVVANPDGTQVGTGTSATSLGKAVDSVAGATDTGVAVLVVRDDALSNITPADGDYTTLRVDNQGVLWARLSGPVNLNATKADDQAFNIGVDSVFPIGAVADETGSDSVDEGDVGAVRMTLTRFLKVSMGDLISGEDQDNSLLATTEQPLANGDHAKLADVSTAAEASSVIKGSAGRLYGFTFSNGNAAVRYFQISNTTTLPADGTVPALTFACPANSTITHSFPSGIYFDSGMVWCNSSTANTKTIGGADSIANVQYF